MATTALRGLQMLETLAGMRQPATLRDIADRAGLSQSNAFRILQALEQEGYLHHLGRSGYRLASRSLALATVIGPRPAMLRLMYPVAARLAAISGEAAVIHLRAGHFRVLVLGVPARSGPILDPAGVLGERTPLASGASGRVILAHLPEAERARIDFEGVTPEQLATIRERGYETSHGENHPGINGISVPLLAEIDNPSDFPIALGAMTIAGPAERLPDGGLLRLAGPLQAACRDLSPRLAALLGPNPGATLDALDL
ncbi:IclR family transcriptional regulator [Mycolicibacterium goodii]|uniref:Helix-turn-helix domain-containing protein n=1 Tax=Mycolicibacterium goodii TaxID=134601 RepID=A0ABS6HWW4_MYCGD|nr:helix-turn-helix domain-containing protein [Mycolicibacterium goodii]MBU8817109.1 helix-turn-helix domain-containing protein [Mycolicibacterium goodii]MBU8827055.1 helix-turn-helix domain-containing protein [Mycolicibacterium goodii]MBU8840587.1 helix-turn-helix domain-containing protein [Mycolicibacterium goodii]